MVCVVCWCCDICQPKYILLLLYMQTALFGAPQMKPQISCNLKLFTHKKWTLLGGRWCGLGLRACLAQQHNEATHTLRVFCARRRENKGLGLNYSPAAAAGRQSVLLGAGCCCCCCCLSTVKSNTGGGAPFAPFAPFIACAWCGACGVLYATPAFTNYTHTHT